MVICCASDIFYPARSIRRATAVSALVRLIILILLGTDGELESV